MIPTPPHAIVCINFEMSWEKLKAAYYDFFMQMVYLCFRIFDFFPLNVRLFSCSFIITEVESNSKDQSFGFSLLDVIHIWFLLQVLDKSTLSSIRSSLPPGVLIRPGKF